ncbi:MAG: site-specific integrase, partial [Rhodococcus ruber]|nr:site-specific integrase [Rhodococcus ruber]
MLARQLDAYLDHLTVERGAAPNTLASYRRDLTRYLEHLTDLGIADLAEVREEHVGDFVTALRRGDPERGRPALAASSAARALVAVRGLHRFATTEGRTPVDVARAVKPPAAGRRLPKALPVADVSAILDAAGTGADGPRDLRDRALLELLYSTGARISEAVGLDVDDLDTTHRSVLLRGKGGKQRVVPVGRPALAAVDAY